MNFIENNEKLQEVYDMLKLGSKWEHYLKWK